MSSATSAVQPTTTASRRSRVARYGVGTVSCSSAAGSRPISEAAPIPATRGSPISSAANRLRMTVPRWSAPSAASMTASRTTMAATNGGASTAAQPARRTSYRQSRSGLTPGG